MMVNKELWAARQLRGLTQVQLASKSGLFQSDISRIERGWTPPHELQRKLAEALELKTEDLFPPERELAS